MYGCDIIISILFSFKLLRKVSTAKLKVTPLIAMLNNSQYKTWICPEREPILRKV